jgi:hypothetical protein
MSYYDQVNMLTSQPHRDIGEFDAKSTMDSRQMYNNIWLIYV